MLVQPGPTVLPAQEKFYLYQERKHHSYSLQTTDFIIIQCATIREAGSDHLHIKFVLMFTGADFVITIIF